jgi:hypothetical protein
LDSIGYSNGANFETIAFYKFFEEQQIW